MNTDYKLPEKGTKEYLRRKEKFKKVQERKKKAKKKKKKAKEKEHQTKLKVLVTATVKSICQITTKKPKSNMKMLILH